MSIITEYLDKIEEECNNSELAVLQEMSNVYSKSLMILENYEGSDNEIFTVFQESDVYYQEGKIADEMKKSGAKYGTFMKILTFIPRLLAAFFKVITGKSRENKIKVMVKCCDKKLDKKVDKKVVAAICGAAGIAVVGGTTAAVIKHKKNDHNNDNDDNPVDEGTADDSVDVKDKKNDHNNDAKGTIDGSNETVKKLKAELDAKNKEIEELTKQVNDSMRKLKTLPKELLDKMKEAFLTKIDIAYDEEMELFVCKNGIDPWSLKRCSSLINYVLRAPTRILSEITTTRNVDRAAISNIYYDELKNYKEYPSIHVSGGKTQTNLNKMFFTDRKQRSYDISDFKDAVLDMSENKLLHETIDKYNDLVDQVTKNNIIEQFPDEVIQYFDKVNKDVQELIIIEDKIFKIYEAASKKYDTIMESIDKIYKKINFDQYKSIKDSGTKIKEVKKENK